MRSPHCLCVLVLVALGGCTAIRRNEAKFDGEQLAAAGFTTRPADPAAPKSPPLKVVAENQDGHLVYHYADPYGCRCEYVGDEQAYTRYRLLMEDDFLDVLLSVPVL